MEQHGGNPFLVLAQVDDTAAVSPFIAGARLGNMLFGGLLLDLCYDERFFLNRGGKDANGNDPLHVVCLKMRTYHARPLCM